MPSSKDKESDELLYSVTRYGPRTSWPAQEGIHRARDRDRNEETGQVPRSG